MDTYDDELDPSDWMKLQYSKSAKYGENIAEENKKLYFDTIANAYGSVPLEARQAASRHKTYSDILEANISHQRMFLQDVLTVPETRTWNDIYAAITPQDSFAAFASETPRGDEAILLSAPAFQSCINYSDFLIWRFTQHGKRVHEFSTEQKSTFTLFMQHVSGSLLGVGTLVPIEELQATQPKTEGDYLARAVSATSILFFMTAHEFAHFHLGHKTDEEARASGDAEIDADRMALDLLSRHIFYNAPKMKLNPSVIPMMMLAPFSCLSLCKIILHKNLDRDEWEKDTRSVRLNTRFDTLHGEYYYRMVASIGKQNFQRMEMYLRDYFFADIPEIGVFLYSEADLFAQALAILNEEINKK